MSIVDAFNRYFEMIPATSDELKQEVYKIRHEVYCAEKKFLEVRVDAMEFDEYDDCSSHYLIRHIESGFYMATARLILPDRHNPEKLFSLETLSDIDKTKLPKNINRYHLAELSRFCVSKNFRRRACERNLLVTNDVDDDHYSREEKESSAHITLALFTCAIKMSVEQDIRYWYAIMEPALKRVVANLGIYFIEIGPPIDFHGTRIPCIIKLDDLLKDASEKNLDYWNMLTNNGQYKIKI